MTISATVTVLGLCLAGTVLLIVAAVTMWFAKGRVALRWSHVVTRLWSVVLLGITLLLLTPHVSELLLGFGTPLPHFGVVVFKLSESVRAYFPQLLLLGLVAMAVEMVFVEHCLRRDEEEQIEFAKLCSFLVTSVFGLTLLFCEFGIAIALIKLSNDLS